MKIILTTTEELSEIIAREVQKCFATQSTKAVDTLTTKQGHYTSKELQSLFGISHTSIWNYERKGILKPVILSRKKFYLKTDIEELIKVKKVKKRA